MAGRTPNPCVLCNTHIKWSALLKRADALDCEFIATGHYAKINSLNDRLFVSMAKDVRKDQSYVLWGLSQECLQRSIFPLGPYTKPEVRQMAADFGYLDLAKKGESYEICFVPDNDYRGFLKRRMPHISDELKGGLFIDQEGNILGEHEGYPFYTIGQRKGLGRAFGKPMYVTEIQADSNTVVLGEVDSLLKNGMRVYKTNSMKYASFPENTEVLAQVRYNDPGTLSTLYPEGDEVKVDFQAHVRGVAPGQSAVFYEGEDVIGGGIIKSSLK
jgi:tRNA-specific 2-thiouridylase